MYKKIFVPVDLNQESSWKSAFPVAVKMAQENGASLAVLSVVPDFGMSIVGSFFPPDYAENVLKEAEKNLKALVDREVPADMEVSSYVRHGTIYKRIIKAADELGADLIVLASHRPETKDYLLGPNAARVVRHARQSVFVVRE
ncbi:MAG: universal stress protein [Rhodobacteraceae bacterium]|nr:universal stress protein [Paracoccaceae bacterium]